MVTVKYSVNERPLKNEDQGHGTLQWVIMFIDQSNDFLFRVLAEGLQAHWIARRAHRTDLGGAQSKATGQIHPILI